MTPDDASTLSAEERRVLREMPEDLGAISETNLFARLTSSMPDASIRRGLELLKKRGAIRDEINEKGRDETRRLTPLGARYAKDGTPAERLGRSLRANPGQTLADLRAGCGLSPEEFDPALGDLRKAKGMETRDGRLFPTGGEPESVRTLRWILEDTAQHPEGATLASLPNDAHRIAARQAARGRFALLIIDVREDRTWRLTPKGIDLRRSAGRETSEDVSVLTPAMLRDGSWKKARFRPYNLALQPPRIVAGRRHPYRAFLDGVRSKLTALGFEEMRGPVVESEFWDMDALFMPQTHPARAIHDVYRVDRPARARGVPEDLADRVARAHEDGGGTGSRGWGYRFDREATRRLVLRSQGTALSARWLARHARSPGKYFAIARCFRPDVVDATHAADFFQVEGIVLGPEIRYGHLLGLLEMFGRELAQAEAYEVRPGYFPFTEPSVEAFIRHPRIGWMELGGAGLFRPELTAPLGVKDPVIAWGLGLDRMAMVALGVDDIRDLFSPRLSTLREMRSAPVL